MTTSDNVRDDLSVLTKRVIGDGKIFMFGEDGNGQHGSSDQALRSDIIMYDIALTVDDEDNPSEFFCLLKLYISGYDSQKTGHAITDKNLEICLNQMFQRVLFSPGTWEWGSISLQGRDYIALNIDVPKFLGWA